MKKTITFKIDDHLYDKFCYALQVSDESETDAIETSMCWYITQVAKMKFKEQRSSDADKADSNDFFGKASGRIPTWARKKDQYNHKIIRAYFEAEDIAGEVTRQMMEQLCSDPSHPELYVPTFRANYAQMKADGPQTHGKVFEDDGLHVWIWKEVEPVLLQYKEMFYHREEQE